MFLEVFKINVQDERAEASDIITATLENTGWGPTKIATQIKMAYDKSFGAAWQVNYIYFIPDLYKDHIFSGNSRRKFQLQH